MNRSALFLMLFASTLAYGEKDPAKGANALFQAGAYQKAIDAYAGLLKVQDFGIKKEVLTFNIGTAHLANHEYQKALDQFSKVLSHEDSAPKYLVLRTYYNLILGYMGKADEALDHLDEKTPMNTIDEAKALLERAQESFVTFIELKYPDLEAYLEKPQEVIDLKNSLKELNSKLKRVHEEVLISSLNFSGANRALLGQLEERLIFLDAYLRQELPKDQEKYLLSRQYSMEKKLLPFWKRMEEIIQEALDEAEREAVHKDKLSQKQDENLDKQKSHRALFDQANNRHYAAVDGLKESLLFRSRQELAKAHLDLTIMDKVEKGQDGLEFCLKEKMTLKKIEMRAKEGSRYREALNGQIGNMSTMAYGLVHHQYERIHAFKSSDQDKKTFAKLDELREVKDLDMIQQILGKLRERLENETDPSFEKLCEDYHLHLISKIKPEDLLVKLYEKLTDDEKLNPGEQEEVHYQFFALKERLDIQSKFSYDPVKNKQIHYAKEKLPLVEDFLSRSEWSAGRDQLKDLLVNYHFKRFLISELNRLKQSTQTCSSEPFFTKENKVVLAKEAGEVEKLSEYLQNPEEYQETIDGLKSDFESFDRNLDMAAADTYQHKVQKHLLKSAGEHLGRMSWNLSEETKKSSEILTFGISEEKLSLEFTTQAKGLMAPNQEAKSAFENLTRESQEFPLKAVATFLDAYYSEQAQQTASSERASQKGEVLKYFKAGRVEAEAALKLLSEPSIPYEDVESKQELAIEYWQKALKALGGDSSQNQDQQNQDSSGQGPGGGNAPEPEQSPEGNELGMSENEAGEGGGEQDQELRDILQALQEMQQEDQIRKPPEQQPKRGLRPW